ncbi:hypothetical protein PHLCEN_2v9043 [Hermanssonia centrifuga]|uniref:Calcineurin-like phosphoesterase domain-containing protein n=1 Tax=Hermanssonia centrifuga TaxID=98765 RepID=A0A2R6NSM3_9APHY|nr:hypothetical protein PHLCEN_2v9043 [Hermanssonia centrifuga]
MTDGMSFFWTPVLEARSQATSSRPTAYGRLFIIAHHHALTSTNTQEPIHINFNFDNQQPPASIWAAMARTSGRTRRPTLWSVASWVSISAFLTVFLFLGLINQSTYGGLKKKKPQYDFPDFNRIETFTRVLSENDVNLNGPDNRMMFIGDVHGMNESLHDMLAHLKYNPTVDTLFFAGDLLAKSTHSSSLSVLHFLTENHKINGTDRVFPVRGNHDQLVVQWRAWREWFEGLTLPLPASASSRSRVPFFFRNPLNLAFQVRSNCLSWFSVNDETSLERRMKARQAATPPVSTGKEFLQILDVEWALEKIEGEGDPEEYADVARKRSEGTWRESWWRRIPSPGKGKEDQQWRIFSDHYFLARDMTPAQASYLFSLPLVNHIPHMHLFVVHAGLLPSDPNLEPTDPRQPLARVPIITGAQEQQLFGTSDDFRLDAAHTSASQQLYSKEELRRRMQETALLRDIPQNRDSWAVLNMRGVRKKGKVTRDGDKGTPWSDIWNEQMDLCDGFGFSDFSLPSSNPEGGERGLSSEYTSGKHKKPKYDLRCRPMTVIYGHAASRGLDIKRWSMGLDTGCLYGRKLTALVLTPSGDMDLSKRRVRFGDRDAGVAAKLMSVYCPVIDKE